MALESSLCHHAAMDYEVLWDTDENAELEYPLVVGNRRPSHVLVENMGIVGMGLGSSDELRNLYVLMNNTDLWVPKREAFIAYGGDLIYDVVLEVGFDGIESPLLEVRYRRRPDLNKAITSTSIRSIHLEPLIRRAISECRTAYRIVEEGRLWRVSPQDRRAIYLPAITNAKRHSRRYVTDTDLERVAQIYVRAVGDRRNPTKAVEEELGLSNRNVAKKRVQMAREGGFLPPSLGERRGGIQ